MSKELFISPNRRHKMSRDTIKVVGDNNVVEDSNNTVTLHEHKVELTPEQVELVKAAEKKMAFDEAVSRFVENKLLSDVDWWYATRNFVTQDFTFTTIGGRTFEPAIKEGKIYVGELWVAPVVKSKKGKK